VPYRAARDRKAAEIRCPFGIARSAKRHWLVQVADQKIIKLFNIKSLKILSFFSSAPTPRQKFKILNH
jgi:hypothetical protein